MKSLIDFLACGVIALILLVLLQGIVLWWISVASNITSDAWILLVLISITIGLIGTVALRGKG